MTKKKVTDQQVIDALKEHGGSKNAAAKSLGIARASVQDRVRSMTKRGWSPDHDMTHIVPDGFRLKGTSTLYGEDGKPKLQWVKSQVDGERQHAMMREAISAMAEELPRLKPKKAEYVNYSDELMAFYPIADPHLGMMSWGDETGEDWDIKIAEEKIFRVLDRLVKNAPRCEHATIVNLGDMFHSENMEGVTSRGGHSLDMDTRYAKMIQVGIRLIRQIITSALEHHENVSVVNTPGNHDETAALFLSVALSHIYENEPRVTIDVTPTVFQYIRWGKCLVGIHHGHVCKPDKLMGVMASDRAKDWGDTEHRYWLTGHIHHDSRKEYSGCTVESFRTLIARDAYAHSHGYRSQRDSKCLVLHKEYGEIERHTVNVGMV